MDQKDGEFFDEPCSSSNIINKKKKYINISKKELNVAQALIQMKNSTFLKIKPKKISKKKQNIIKGIIFKKKLLNLNLELNLNESLKTINNNLPLESEDEPLIYLNAQFSRFNFK